MRNLSCWTRRLSVAAAVVCATTVWTRAEFLGSTTATSFDLCESATDSTGRPRPECQGGDLRFQYDGSTPQTSQFGFAVAVGHLNGDDRADLVVGDPGSNRVYIFFGRIAPHAAYGQDPNVLADRLVSSELEADVILTREPAFPGQVGSFGFSVAVSAQRVAGTCPPGSGAGALLVGAPGRPGTSGNDPGTVFHLPAGTFCAQPMNPPSRLTVDPIALGGQSFQAPTAATDDEFGYSVAFGRLITGSSNHPDAIVGARGALGGAGSVTIFPVTDGTVGLSAAGLVRVHGSGADGLGESLSVGDLDLDFNATTVPLGRLDDLAIGAIGHSGGKVLIVQGPVSPTEGQAMDGILHEGVDPQIRSIVGEQDGDAFGFSVAVSAKGDLAVGAVMADNNPPNAQQPGGGDPLTNVASGTRSNAGKVYVWRDDVVDAVDANTPASEADLVLVARRSGDQLGFSLAWGDFDGTGMDDLAVAARREDGSGLKVNEIDQGTVYVIYESSAQTSPVDLNVCNTSSDCTGVSGVDVMLFGGDRAGSVGDEMGFAMAAGNFNGDTSSDLFASSRTHLRVYAATMEDTDADRATKGRNLRDDDDDNDAAGDATDCAPLASAIKPGANEIGCNNVDENCNGMLDDAPDADGDGFDTCNDNTPGDRDDKAADCADNDAASRPGATEVCDGNDNDCSGSVPATETDSDNDRFAGCTGWNDTQGDQALILGGDDCDRNDATVFPGSAPNESSPMACRRDRDGDDFGDAAPPVGITPGTDCDDSSTSAALTFPGAAPQEANPSACMRDVDGDDYGDLTAPAGIVRGTDCDDRDAGSHPGQAEVCDGNDNDCAGGIPVAETDSDGDHFAGCTPWADVQSDNPTITGGGDCAPTDGFSFPGASPSEIVPGACTRDEDGDNFGDLTPPAGVTAGTDCSDDPPGGSVTFPGAAQIEGPLNCMKDGDDDGYGDAGAALPVVKGGDCDDAQAARFPGAAEVADDGIDQDCSGADTKTCFVDSDSDGFGTTTTLLAADGDCTDPGESAFNTDCDDASPAFSPGVTDVPGDGIDQNCNGADSITCFVDADHDGFGTVAGTTTVAGDGVCDAAQGEAPGAGDCSDADASTHPGAMERCDGNDNDCSAGLPAAESDADGDGFVVCSGWADTQADNPAISGGGDCDAGDPDTFPGAASAEGFASACMRDKDADNYGDLTPPAGVTPGSDCDDDSPGGTSTFPGAAEIEAPLNCMKDADADGYGDGSVALPVVAGTDCDDDHGGTHPGATEACDGNDNDCTSGIPAAETDPDGDGYAQCTPWNDVQADNPAITGGGDCDPADPAAHPGAGFNEAFSTACMQDKDGDGYGDLTPPSGVTAGSDCDDDSASGAATFPGAAQVEGPLNCMKDADDDGWGDPAAALPVVPGTDCSDADPTRFPGAPEVPGDGIDQDCNGSDALSCFADGDGDGFGSTTALPPGDADCTDPGESSVSTDCDDASAAIHPGVMEVPDDGIDQDCSGADTITCVLDADLDGHGTLLGTPVLAADGACHAAQGESGVADDCDDANATIFPGATEVPGDGIDQDCSGADAVSCFVDGDGDGHGSAMTVVALDGDCSDPGESASGADCDDANPAIFPGAAEIVGDGIDQDCDGSDLVSCFADTDGDGFGGTSTIPPGDADCSDPGESAVDTDCNDGDAGIHPGAAEVVGDGIDQDCSGTDTISCVADVDRDGFGTTAATPVPASDGVCDTVQGESVNATDCDDDDATVFPGAVEIVGDGIDQDCSGADSVSCFQDADGDGYGSTATLTAPDGDCTDPGESASDTDCDDSDNSIHPGATETAGDGIDQDCNGVDALSCVADVDQDGHGTSLGTPVLALDGSCDTAQGEAVSSDDCDDASAAIHPGAAEVPDDGLDQDCSGSDSVTCFLDGDADGFGGTATIVAPDGDCSDLGESTLDTDCDDASATIHPGAAEIPADGIDQDCDGSDLPACFADSDGDGYGSSTPLPPGDADCTDPGESSVGTDCDDGNAAIHPGATEVPSDGIDQDCNGTDAIACVVDADQDGHGTQLATPVIAGDGTCDAPQGEAASSDDCNDADAGIHPGAVEIPNDGIDQDCSGSDLVSCFVDVDLDGYGSSSTVTPADGDCNDPGESTVDTDCDDALVSVHPGASETADDGIDQDCSGSDTITCVVDADADGHGTVAGTTVLAADGVCDAAQGESATAGDCDDGDPITHPGAGEACDGNDNDCSGGIPADEIDADGDSFVGCTVWMDSQSDNPGVAGGGDCDPTDLDTFPGSASAEVFSTACMRDKDADGFGDISPPAGVTAGSDCDDDSPAGPDTFPGAAQIEAPLNCMKDVDDDGYGDSAASLPVVAGGDCNDLNANVHPTAPETCGDLIDSDCDGSDPICLGGLPVPEISLAAQGGISWSWPSSLAATGFAVYRGDLILLRSAGVYSQTPRLAPEIARFCNVADSQIVDPFEPAPGRPVFYIVEAKGPSGGSTLGVDSSGQPRPNHHPCGQDDQPAPVAP